MNRKLVITAAGGFGLGALISWAITADHFEMKARNNRAGFRKVIEDQQKLIWGLQDGIPMEDLLSGTVVNEEEEGRVLTEARLHSLSLDPEPNAFGESIEIIQPIDVDSTAEGQEAQAKYEEDDEVDEEEYEQTRANLKAQIAQYIENPDDHDMFIEQVVAIEANRNEPPFVIPVSLFAWDEEEGNDYAKTTITFYSRERILVDEDEEAIDPKDVNEYVGWKNLDRFGDQSEDADVVYIRNRRLKNDFEVVQTDEPVPAHIKYGMDKHEYRAQKAAGNLKFREE